MQTHKKDAILINKRRLFEQNKIRAAKRKLFQAVGVYDRQTKNYLGSQGEWSPILLAHTLNTIDFLKDIAKFENPQTRARSNSAILRQKGGKKESDGDLFKAIPKVNTTLSAEEQRKQKVFDTVIAGISLFQFALMAGEVTNFFLSKIFKHVIGK